MKHTGTLAFETERLICRRFCEGDTDDAFSNWASDPDVQLEYGEPVYADISQVSKLIKGYISAYDDPSYYRWAMTEKLSGRNIGQIALCKVWSEQKTAEIEYCIGREFWGRGYAGEALEGMIGFLFSHTGFERLEAYHRAENRKSGRVLEKSRMHVTDNIMRFKSKDSIPVGEVCYCIEKNEYNERKL